jgi:acetylglutamate kinase
VNRSAVRVIKVGGGEMVDPVWLERFALGVRHARPAIVVHGGGRAISAWQERLGVPVVMRDGIRVTTPEVAELVRMVLCGPVRGALVGALRQHGVHAAGVAGGDGCLTVELVDPPRLGQVGRVVRVDCELLHKLLEVGLTPVLAPISVAADGAVVNVNADEAAAAVARELGAAELLFVSDVAGVMEGARRLPMLAPSDLDRLIVEGVVRGGMVAKLKAALVVAGGIPCRVGDLAMLSDPAAGTRLLARVGEAA